MTEILDYNTINDYNVLLGAERKVQSAVQSPLNVLDFLYIRWETALHSLGRLRYKTVEKILKNIYLHLPIPFKFVEKKGECVREIDYENSFMITCANEILDPTYWVNDKRTILLTSIKDSIIHVKNSMKDVYADSGIAFCFFNCRCLL